eukprot:919118-Pelagomonas_calceolata.AAC.8
MPWLEFPRLAHFQYATLWAAPTIPPLPTLLAQWSLCCTHACTSMAALTIPIPPMIPALPVILTHRSLRCNGACMARPKAPGFPFL